MNSDSVRLYFSVLLGECVYNYDFLDIFVILFVLLTRFHLFFIYRGGVTRLLMLTLVVIPAAHYNNIFDITSPLFLHIVLIIFFWPHLKYRPFLQLKTQLINVAKCFFF